MSAGPARAISLDVDGTLYRVRRFTVAWRLRHERGLLLALMAAREKIRHEPPFPTRAALHRREAELVAPSFELELADAEARLEALRGEIAGALTERIRPFPGVRGALEAAHARGLQLAVLSDYDPDEKLANLGLADLPWRVRVSAEGEGALKPHARAFLRVAEALELPPAEIVHVGDREDVDTEGALAAGLRAWRFAAKKGLPTKAERAFTRWTLDVFAPLWAPPKPLSSS